MNTSLYWRHRPVCRSTKSAGLCAAEHLATIRTKSRAAARGERTNLVGGRSRLSLRPALELQEFALEHNCRLVLTGLKKVPLLDFPRLLWAPLVLFSLGTIRWHRPFASAEPMRSQALPSSWASVHNFLSRERTYCNDR